MGHCESFINLLWPVDNIDNGVHGPSLSRAAFSGGHNDGLIVSDISYKIDYILIGGGFNGRGWMCYKYNFRKGILYSGYWLSETEVIGIGFNFPNISIFLLNFFN